MGFFNNNPLSRSRPFSPLTAIDVLVSGPMGDGAFANTAPGLPNRLGRFAPQIDNCGLSGRRFLYENGRPKVLPVAGGIRVLLSQDDLSARRLLVRMLRDFVPRHLIRNRRINVLSAIKIRCSERANGRAFVYNCDKKGG
jgi:hypothetical protein